MPAWRRLGLTRGQGLLLVGVSAAAGAIGFVPLFGGPGYESALALGLILPLPVACSAARRAFRGAGEGDQAPPLPLQVWSDALGFTGVLLLIQLALCLIHGLRVGFCDPVQGLLLLVLGPVFGCVLAATWGSAVGVLVTRSRFRRRRWLAYSGAALGPLGGVVLSAWRFWQSPMIFAFDPFVGFFAGTLYDTVIDPVPRLVTYRLGSAGSLLAVAAWFWGMRTSSGRVWPEAWWRRPASALVASCGATLSAAIYLWGPELGHYQTTATIRAALGQSLASERCDIIYPESLPVERARLLGEECDAHVQSHEQYFATRLRARVTVFTFASARQKGALMGASNTYIAKPWRNEVYIQSDNYPHPVLGHELAHVVAGAFGSGPFRVAGPLGGWVPDPGRIEGFAVAAAPTEDTDYTLFEWTRALRDLGLLPPIRRIFRLSFLGENSSTAYTVAGAFVDWLHDAYGADRLRAWYEGVPLASAFDGKTLDVLELEFNSRLDAVRVSDAMLELARARFDRPAIFGRRCPHVVDRLLEDAGGAFERAELAAAALYFSECLELDPQNFSARLGLAACDQRRGSAREAEARYQSLAQDNSLTRVQRGVALERLGDIAYLAPDLPAAIELYDQAERFAFDEHRSRTIEVKRYGLQNDLARRAIAELLIGDGQSGPDLFQASATLGEWSMRESESGLADYLIGKNLYSRVRWQAANEHLQRALGRQLPLLSVRREALRTSVFAGCAIGDRQSAQSSLAQYLADPGLSLARKNGMERFTELCRPLHP
jgi:tetratricopeptide (TPR) repeat protein